MNWKYLTWISSVSTDLWGLFWSKCWWRNSWTKGSAQHGEGQWLNRGAGKWWPRMFRGHRHYRWCQPREWNKTWSKKVCWVATLQTLCHSVSCLILSNKDRFTPKCGDCSPKLIWINTILNKECRNFSESGIWLQIAAISILRSWFHILRLTIDCTIFFFLDAHFVVWSKNRQKQQRHWKLKNIRSLLCWMFLCTHLGFSLSVSSTKPKGKKAKEAKKSAKASSESSTTVC